MCLKKKHLKQLCLLKILASTSTLHLQSRLLKALPGVGFATAKKIVELRMSLSGERFANLKQLENIPRVNWEQLIEEDLIFIS